MSRIYDEQVEATVSQLMVGKLWKTAKHFEKVEDRERQFKGIDYIVDGLNIDEKVKFKGCMNQVYQWPGFECYRKMRNGEFSLGWFLDPNIETDLYSIVNVWTIDGDDKSIELGKVTKLHLTLVCKKELLAWVGSLTPLKQL